MVWTSESVANAIKQAVEISKRSPKVGPQGYKVNWMEINYDKYEIYFMDKKIVRKRPLSQYDINLWENVLEWIQILPTDEEKKLIWLKASSLPWKIICKRIGKSKQTLWTTWKNSLEYLAKNLNDTTKKWYEKNHKMYERHNFLSVKFR